MRVSYQDMLDTPIEVVMRDLSFHDTESRVERHLTEKQQNA